MYQNDITKSQLYIGFYLFIYVSKNVVCIFLNMYHLYSFWVMSITESILPPPHTHIFIKKAQTKGVC